EGWPMKLLCLSLLLALSATCLAAFPEPEKLPASKKLPDPLVMLDGTKVETMSQWKKKRAPELRELFQHYMYGTIPPAPKKVTAKILHEDKKALDGKAHLTEVALGVGPEKWPKIHLLVVLPKGDGPHPVFVGPNFSGNHCLLDDPGIRLPTAWMYD